MRHLILVLGDQLDHANSAFDGFDPAHDAVWMSETPDELTHVWCHKLRIAFFLSAMRHFRDDLKNRGWPVHYNILPLHAEQDQGKSFADLLKRTVTELRPAKLIVTEPGDHRVLVQLRAAAADLAIKLEICEDRSFLCSRAEFSEFAASHKTLLMETFYRRMRTRLRLLLDKQGRPAGGKWNFDSENRRSFGRSGPPPIEPPPRFPPDTITSEVADLVNARFANHPGNLKDFDLPVDRPQALAALAAFVDTRLAQFGEYQDAMWTREPFLHHSRLSAAINVKLISPREAIDAALAAYEDGNAPLNSVEGFIRQIAGWREFVRGVYWTHMPDYANRNTLGASHALPDFYWTAATDMNCLHHSIAQVVDHAYAHHIQRLMVIGNFALLYGVDPFQFNEWHMAMYADAIDWVSLPNTLGMSQHADGGVFATKPYCASGNYISRMSDYCRDCRYDPKKSVGADACPFTTLYWVFLDRHRERLSHNPRMHYPLENLKRKSDADLRQIRQRGEEIYERHGG